MSWNFRVALAVLVLGVSAPATLFSQTSPPPEKIQELIDQLGDRNFTVRERAQSDLARLGITAFDQLFGATRSTDLEVARRAQYLIRSIEITWTQPEFSAEVNAYLSRYGKLSPDKRLSRVAELAQLNSLDALSALCRISRYEVSETISKQAALAAAIGFQDAADAKRPQIAEIIDERLASSPRVGPSWLQIFRQSLDDPQAALARWQEQVAREIDLLTHRPALTNQQIVLDLVRWQVDQLRHLDRQEDALAAMRNVIGISTDFSESQLIDLTTWFLARSGPSVVEELATYHAGQVPPDDGVPVGGIFGESPMLLYLLAEALLVQGKVDLAQQHADAALSLRSDSSDSHFIVAEALADRGCFRWSRREYRLVIDRFDVQDGPGQQARMLLSEMEHDQGNHKQAAEVMWPWVEATEKSLGADDPFDRNANEFLGRLLARAYLFRATHAEKQGDIAAAKKDLETALKYVEDEADTLIAAWRIDDDPQWREKAKERIDHTLDFFKPYIEKFEEQYKFFKENGSGMGAQGPTMANYCNQYSWLVANTYGDFDHALRSSHLSLEIVPGNGAYLDTLAHCYAAKEDWASAVKYQKQAVQKLPHSGQIRGAYRHFAQKCRENNIDFEPIELPESPDVHFEKAQEAAR